MSTEFPSMPPGQPCTPDEDGFANVKIVKGGVSLELGDGTVMTIPNLTILKNSVRVFPGGSADINRVQLTLLASKVTVDGPFELRDGAAYLDVPCVEVRDA